jgi:GntR family transcriptional repressor for pyruvate dehydrogenase complex
MNMSGEVPRGSKLPTEKELAEKFGESKAVIRRALTRLRNDRLVYSKQGAGYFVAAMPPSSSSGSDLGADFSFTDIYSMRKLLDGYAAACVTRDADPEVIQKLGVLIDEAYKQLEAAQWDLVEARRIDWDFHTVISEACRNGRVKPMREVTSVGIGSFWFPWARLDIQVQIGMTRAAVEEQERVFEAIKGGDPDAAEAAMRDHFDGALRRYRERFGDANPCH